MNSEKGTIRIGRGLTIRLVLLCAACALGRGALAGDLNPPAGAVAPTHKTLTQVEPRIEVNAANTPGDSDSLFRIVQPGSYYITGNITGVVAKRGIEIASNDVTLDLMGFTLQGVAGSLAGVGVTNTLNNITIRNGVVRQWGADGVDCAFSTLEKGRLIENIHSFDNVGFGISAGVAAIVRQCVASDNGASGIAALFDSQIESCTSTGNNTSGFTLSDNSIIQGCIAQGGSIGINSGGTGTRIINCTARSAAGDGIVCSLSATVSGCTASDNTGDGIQVSSDAVVIGNTCRGNGAGVADGAGIHVIGSACRVLNNSVMGADRGIDIDGTLNLVTGNVASGNTTEYSIIAGNGVGPILTAGGVATTTIPTANFEF